MTRSRAIRNSIEARTGMIWGRYRLTETFGITTSPQPMFHVMLHPKESGWVRVEGGFGRNGFYLSWDEIPKAQRTRRLGLRKALAHASR